MQLDPAIQNYAWGKLGGHSAVASLYQSAKPGYKLDSTAPYAELWMGTHPNGPAFCTAAGDLLIDFIRRDPTVLGQKSRELFGDDLPFLFKVLSVNKALSIQAHPNKSHAEKLHASRPAVYKDPNHKPEMAIALTDFEGLCGFRPWDEIKTFINEIPPLQAAVGDDAAAAGAADETADRSEVLRRCFTGLITCDKSVLAEQLDKHKADVEGKEAKTASDQLFLRLLAQFPGDVGCFVLYFLNHVRLQPGEAMFLGPNLPHAYLAGDCIECMACSDNVVRAGLTPKLIDADTLCEMLDYTCASDAEEAKFRPTEENAFTQLYDPPVPDFAVAKLGVPKAEAFVDVPKRDSASILICTKGGGKFRASRAFDGGDVSRVLQEGDLRRGMVLFLAAGEQLEIQATDVDGLYAFQAFC